MDFAAQWVDRTEVLEEVLEGLGAGPLAVDTEADSLHHYPEKVCLIQLSFDGRDYLVDPLAELSLDPLARRFADPSIVKILHGADYDLRMLQRGFGMTFAGVFDTMIAARFLGRTRFGLAALLDEHFGVAMDKKFQRADWSLRPLSPEMARYASMDTHYLIRLHEELDARLEALGRRGWAAEEFERLERVRASPAEPADEGFRRVKGSAKLERNKLAVLRELWSFREAYARRLDRPPFRVLHDERLMELCGLVPASVEELGRVEKLPRPWRHGRRARELFDAIRRGVALPREDWPARSKAGRSRPVTRTPGPRFEALRAQRDRIAAELELEPALVGPRGLLEQIAQRLDEGTNPTDLPELRRWQWDLLAPSVVAGPA